MPLQHLGKTPKKLLQQLKPMFDALPTLVGNDAVVYFKKNFDNQSFDGAPWPKRKSGAPRDQGRKILVDRGLLYKSVAKEVSGWKVRVYVRGGAERYAGIHNFGGTTHPRITAASRKRAWALFYATGNPMYKAMALTKKTSLTVSIPQRRFIGQSRILDNQLKNLIIRELKKALQ